MNQRSSAPRRVAVFLFHNADNQHPDGELDLKEARAIVAKGNGYMINRGRGLRLKRWVTALRAVSGECLSNAPLASLEAMARW